MKIIEYWWPAQPHDVWSLHVRDGRVVCRAPGGRELPTGWRSEAQVRAEFVPCNHNVNYRWYYRCTRRRGGVG